MSVGSMSKCYAAEIGGCGGGLSREHPVSKCLLERLSALGDGADIEAPWFARGRRREMFESAMQTRVLCRDHNRLLSPYDTEACKLFDVILASSLKKLETWETLNGSHIERWALKMLFADVAAGKFKYSVPGNPAAENPPVEWLRVLFEGAPMPRGCGFHFGDATQDGRCDVRELLQHHPDSRPFS